jgi:[ribosomal protein S18]-alanine N-acetyltransferase
VVLDVSSDFHFDRPTIDDLPTIMTLDRLCFGGLWSEDTYRRELASENSHFISVMSSDTIVGFGCFWAILDEAHITLLGIHPEYRQKGLGKSLLLALLARACAIKMARATLEVRTSNQIAIDMYVRLGFKTAGTRKKYYQNPTEDGLVMWLGGLNRSDFADNFSS